MIMNILVISFILWSLIVHYKVRFELRKCEFYVTHLYLIWSIREWNRIDSQYFDITYTKKLF